MQLSWKSYRLLDRANVFVAAALSLGIRPEDFQLRRGSNGRIEWEFSAYEDDSSAEMFRIYQNELQERVTVLEGVRFSQKLFCSDDYDMVSLSKYARWCMRVEEPREPTQFEMFCDENISKFWFRYPLGGGIAWLGVMLIDKPNGWVGWILMAIGCLFMYELALIGLVVGFFYFLFSGIGSLSVPAAIIVGACIIAFAVYKKNN